VARIAAAAAFDTVRQTAKPKLQLGGAVYMKYPLSASGKFGNAEYDNKADIADTDNRTPIIGHH
jgi:hypothetical protein